MPHRLRAGARSAGSLRPQKVVLAKWLSMQPKVVIFDEPTRGVDVGAKNEIYGLMRDLADRGVAILMISSDMEEVIGVSDRIAVMHEGSISGVLERPRFSDHNVRSGSVSPSTFGNLYELYAIAAAVLRGCSLRGSEGSILGIVLGIASLQVPAEPRQHPGHSQFAEFRGDGDRNTAGRVRRSATAETAGRWRLPLPRSGAARCCCTRTWQSLRILPVFGAISA